MRAPSIMYNCGERVMFKKDFQTYTLTDSGEWGVVKSDTRTGVSEKLSLLIS